LSGWRADGPPLEGKELEMKAEFEPMRLNSDVLTEEVFIYREKKKPEEKISRCILREIRRVLWHLDHRNSPPPSDTPR
jgi:hypothetical protein